VKRLLLALVAAGITLIVAEGVLRLGFDRSLLGASAPTADPDAPGLYRPYPHTHVGYVLRADAELAIHDGEIRSDAMGLRRRAGPPPAARVPSCAARSPCRAGTTATRRAS
jgi:hypothetical protein